MEDPIVPQQVMVSPVHIYDHLVQRSEQLSYKERVVRNQAPEPKRHEQKKTISSPLNPDINKYLSMSENQAVSPSPNPIRITKQMIDAQKQDNLLCKRCKVFLSAADGSILSRNQAIQTEWEELYHFGEIGLQASDLEPVEESDEESEDDFDEAEFADINLEVPFVLTKPIIKLSKKRKRSNKRVRFQFEQPEEPVLNPRARKTRAKVNYNEDTILNNLLRGQHIDDYFKPIPKRERAALQEERSYFLRQRNYEQRARKIINGTKYGQRITKYLGGPVSRRTRSKSADR